MKLKKRFNATLEVSFQVIQPDDPETVEGTIMLVALSGVPVGTVPLDSDEAEDITRGLLTKAVGASVSALLDDVELALGDSADEDEEENEEDEEDDEEDE